MPITTVAIWKQHFPQLTGTTEDTLIGLLIDRVDAVLAGWLGFPLTQALTRTVLSATYDLYLDGPSWADASVLCLCVRPITSVTSIRLDPYGTNTLLVAGVDYTFDAQEGLVILLPTATVTWPVGRRGIHVVFVGGFVTAPLDLVVACIMTVRHLWNLRNVQGEVAWGSGGESASLSDTDVVIPAAVKEILAPYRTPCAMKEAA